MSNVFIRSVTVCAVGMQIPYLLSRAGELLVHTGTYIPDIHTYITHTYTAYKLTLHTYIHIVHTHSAYIHKYIHTYIHAPIHTYVYVSMYVQEFLYQVKKKFPRIKSLKYLFHMEYIKQCNKLVKIRT